MSVPALHLVLYFIPSIFWYSLHTKTQKLQFEVSISKSCDLKPRLKESTIAFNVVNVNGTKTSDMCTHIIHSQQKLHIRNGVYELFFNMQNYMKVENCPYA
jgi:hypothetical protein